MNQLQFETSPYLKQHAQNPVNWYPWSEAAFDLALRQNKPVLVSIGYSACHWCHVMEAESFEDEHIAAYMNENFINIKVDREERPDVDHLYMDALQVMTGQGGWPLNMFVTPTKKPFFGGTYFPPKRVYQRASWMEVLEAVNQSWLKKQDELEQQSEQLLQHLAQVNLQESGAASSLPYTKANFNEIIVQLLNQSDDVYGGFGAAPKFPQTMSLQFLLQYYCHSNDYKALDYALFTIDKMLAGGIYDQLGGGLARYSTDAEWLVPHFEKMLYDNALFLDVLADAYAISKNENYKNAILETITFCNNELSINGAGIGFYAALDADSEGIEGKFYVWTKNELIQALPDIDPLILDYFDVSTQGNWEGNNILNYSHVNDNWYLKNELDKNEFSKIITSTKSKLLEVRNKRARPGTDTKVLLSWNALMVKALVKCGLVLNDENLLKQAQLNADFLLTHFQENEIWFRNLNRQRQAINATLEDLAFFENALLQLGEACQDYKYISTAAAIHNYISIHFSDEQEILYYYSNKNVTDIVLRKIETYDGALPSVNAIMAENNLILSFWYDNVALQKRAQQGLQTMAAKAKRYPSSFGYWCKVLLQNANYSTLIAENTTAITPLKQSLTQLVYLPTIIVAVTDGLHHEQIPVLNNKVKTTNEVYNFCAKNRCFIPENSFSSIILKINMEKMLE